MFYSSTFKVCRKEVLKVSKMPAVNFFSFIKSYSNLLNNCTHFVQQATVARLKVLIREGKNVIIMMYWVYGYNLFWGPFFTAPYKYNPCNTLRDAQH